MSLITRCPACGTMFNVVADQLRVSQGWVRCGHCSEVFDASSHLQPAAPPPPLERPQELSPPEADACVVKVSPAPDTALTEQQPVGQKPQEADALATPVSEDEGTPAAVMTDLPALAGDTIAANLDVEASAAAFHDVSFLRQARRQAFWKQTRVRMAFGLLGLLLLAWLSVQWILQHKDSLALIDPRWRTVLQTVCQPLSCAVKPLRRVEALVIDSATFSKSGSDGFRLSFVLKNAADLPLEVPLLELTLTDNQDKAILRRVLTPAQFGYTNGVMLPARTEVTGVVNLSVVNEGPSPPAVSAAAVAGYRVLVFYP